MNQSFFSLFFGQYKVLWDEMFSRGFIPFFHFMPFWGPPVFLYAIFRLYVEYTRHSFFANQKYILLEIRVPREQARSPLAMELVLNAMHITSGEPTWYDRLVLGKRRPFFSLEIVSIEGQVHFFMWTQARFRDVIESHVYSQYPQSEVVEVPDYTKFVPYSPHHGDWEMFGIEFGTKKPDGYPIKTYLDFGLEKGGQEEFEKIDPITPVIEIMGSMRGYEQLWLQIIVRASLGQPEHGFFQHLPDRVSTKKKYTKLEKLATDEVEKIREKYGKNKEDPFALPSQFRLTKGEQDTIAAIERKATKLAFDVGIRGIYVARKDAYRGTNVTGLVALLRPFNSNMLNSLGPHLMTSMDYPWDDFLDLRLNYRKHHMFEAYRMRGWFFRPHLEHWYIMNSEEIATMYHFPGQVSETPTFGRIMSKKAEPPSNLPR